MNQTATENITIAAWAIDFVRAVGERPKILRWIFKLVIGKYAWREFAGLYDSMRVKGYYPDFEYGLEKNEYHKEHPEVWGMK